MNFATTDLTTWIRLTRCRSFEKSRACIEPDTSKQRTMSMPLARTSVRLCARCGRARPAIISTAASSGASQRQPPNLLRVLRATSRARLTSENSMAATGPWRPLPQHHRGQQQQQPEPLGLQEANHAASAAAVASMKRRAVRSSVSRLSSAVDRPANLTMSQFSRNSVRSARCPANGVAGDRSNSCRNSSVVRRLARMLKRCFDVAAHDVGSGAAEFSCGRRHQQWADCVETPQGCGSGSERRRVRAPAAPHGVGNGGEQQRSCDTHGQGPILRDSTSGRVCRECPLHPTQSRWCLRSYAPAFPYFEETPQRRQVRRVGLQLQGVDALGPQIIHETPRPFGGQRLEALPYGRIAGVQFDDLAGFRVLERHGADVG